MDGWPGLQEGLLGKDARNVAVIDLGKMRAVGLGETTRIASR